MNAAHMRRRKHGNTIREEQMSTHHVAIVGGGLGGLAAAVGLACRGLRVSVFEKNAHWGGKMMPVELAGCSFDFGPNTITMPHVFRHIVHACGENPDDYFRFLQLHTHTRNHFANGAVLDFSTDVEAMRTQLDRMGDAAGCRLYPAFLQEVKRIYQLSERHFFPKTFFSLRDYCSPSLAWALLRVRPRESMAHFFRCYFRHPDTLQALNRYATYLGSSPWSTPATFAMIAHLELNQGVYYVEGGNTRLAAGLAALAEKLGAHMRLNAGVQKIFVHNGGARAILLENGETTACDTVILNGDLLSCYPQLVESSQRPHFPHRHRALSTSAFVILAAARARYPRLLHHNVFFSGDYRAEFRDLLERGRYSEDPTLYLCNSSVSEPARAPYGANLFILANAPALGRQPDPHAAAEQERYKNLVYRLLERRGISVQAHLAGERVLTPQTISALSGACQGALYGARASGWRTFLRPPGRSTDIGNLYFVGGSVHPGGGVPMVTLCGWNTARRIVAAIKR